MTFSANTMYACHVNTRVFLWGSNKAVCLYSCDSQWPCYAFVPQAAHGTHMQMNIWLFCLVLSKAAENKYQTDHFISSGWLIYTLETVEWKCFVFYTYFAYLLLHFCCNKTSNNNAIHTWILKKNTETITNNSRKLRWKLLIAIWLL